MNIDLDKLNQDIELANKSTLINQDYEKSFDLFINKVFDSSQSNIQNFKFAAILLKKIRIDNIGGVEKITSFINFNILTEEQKNILFFIIVSRFDSYIEFDIDFFFKFINLCHIKHINFNFLANSYHGTLSNTEYLVLNCY